MRRPGTGRQVRRAASEDHVVGEPPRRRRTRWRSRDARDLRSRISPTDLIAEAASGLLARPGRAVLTVLGTVLGVGALVATLGVAQTAGNQIVGRFDEVTATRISIEPATRQGPTGETAAGSLPWDAEDRLERLRGVESAGTMSDVDVGEDRVRSVPVNDPLGRSELAIPILAASPGLFETVGATVATGRVFDAGHDARGDGVAVLGPGAAEQLNIFRVQQQPAIFVGDEVLVVIGILAEVDTDTRLLNAVVVPDGFARDRMGLASPTGMVVDTALGATGLIAEQAPMALDPVDPDGLDVSAPRDPQGLRDDVQTDIDGLFLLLGGISLLVGAIGIANVTLVSVMERVGEIGVARALGATRRHIAAQFLVESGLMGVAGGILGASGGVLVVVGVSLVQGWTPVLDPRVPLLAPLLGAVVGLLAGLYPSLRAASLEPVEALRSGT